MRDAAFCFLVLASLAGTASADLAPEDPYTDVEPTPLKAEPAINLEIDATSGVGPVVAMPAATVNGVPVEGAAAAGVAKVEPAAKIEIVAPTTNATSKSVDQFEEEEEEEEGSEWYEQQEVQIGGGVGAGLLLLGLLIRGRRAARRRRLALEQRRTQFGMSAVDPSLAKFNVAAWEAGPAVMPTAIEPEMMNRRAQSAPFIQPEPSFVRASSAPIVEEQFAGRLPVVGRAPSAPIISSAQPYVPSLVPQPVAAPIAQPVAPAPQPFVAPASQPFVAPASQPYRHYSNADLAAYGLRPSQPEIAANPAALSAIAPRKSEPKMVMMPHLMQPPGLPAAHVPLPPMPIAVAHTPNAPVVNAPNAPVAVGHAQPSTRAAVQGSWHPTVMPWDQAAAPSAQAAHVPQSFAPHAQHAPYAQHAPHAPHAPQYAQHAPQAPTPYAVAPLPSFAPRGTELPRAPSAQPYHARAFSPAPAIAPDNVRLMRLAEGTPHPPFAPQPFTSLPAPRSLPGMPAPHAAPTVAPHLARTQLSQPQSFVLESSTAALPAAYPLTFPAFPEAAGATMLAPVEPSGLNYWGPLPTEVEVQEDQIIFARGSQPVDQLEPIRRTLPASPNDETRTAQPPQRRR